MLGSRQRWRVNIWKRDVKRRGHAHCCTATKLPNYTLEIKNNSSDTAVPSFSAKAASPEKHWANLDIELWNPSGVMVAETTSATARPESLTYDAPSPGTYTIKVASRDWETSGYTLSTGYQMLAHAPVTARIKDGSGSVVKTISGSSGSLAIDYLAPSASTYTIEIEDTSNETHVPSFTGTTFSSKVRHADLDLELWNSSGQKVAQSTTSSRPESLSYQASPGDYTLKVVSKDFEADFSIAVGYPMVGFADLTFNLKDPQGAVVETARSQSGSVSLNHVTTGGGSYSLEIRNNSSEPVPSYQASWSLDSTMKLELKDPSGAVVASDSTLTSPNSVSKQGLSPGKYTLVATPTGGSGSAILTSSYPGRPAKEVITYDGNDHANSVDDGTTKTEETLSPSGRVLRRIVRDSATNVVSEDVTFGYSDGGDSPSYSKPTAGGAITTYVNGPIGLLVIDVGGVPSYSIQNGHGDVVGTTDSAGAYTANPTTDEFGMGTPPANRLGWLGGKERFSTGGNLNLIRMGVRLYDPALGRFLQVDPVPGGSANDYDYCNADPINCLDLDGRWAYNFDFDIGAGGAGAAERAMFLLQNSPNSFFPFHVSGPIARGSVLSLGGQGHVTVMGTGATSFTFRTHRDHIEGINALITFSTRVRNGRLMLSVRARGKGRGIRSRIWGELVSPGRNAVAAYYWSYMASQFSQSSRAGYVSCGG